MLLFALLIALLSTAEQGSGSSASVSASDEDSSSLVSVNGRTVTLACISGKEGRMIKWEKDGSRLPTNHRQQVQANGSLVISNLQKTDAGQYMCTAKDSTRRLRVSLQVIEAPRLVMAMPPEVMVGMRVMAMCSVSQSTPPLVTSGDQLKWLKDGLAIDESGTRIESNKDYTILSIESVGLAHAGNYSCLVANDGDQLGYSSTLRVNAPAEWLIEPSDRNVISGSAALFDCQAKGSPEPKTTWKKATDPWDTPVYNSPHYTLHSNGSLSILNADAETDGLYFCSASNGFSEIRKVVRLTVLFPVRAANHMKLHSVHALKGEFAELTCSFTGDAPVKITWSKEVKGKSQRKEYKEISGERGVVIHKEDDKLASSKLVIDSTAAADTGFYRCSASNRWGTDLSDPVQLLVKEAPLKPVRVQIVNVTESSVKLTWIEPYDGNGHITKYLARVSDALTNESVATGHSSHTNVTVDGLRPDRPYRVEVSAENEVGWSEASDAVPFRTEEGAPSGAPVSVTAVATGPNSIKLSWKAPSEELWNGRISGYVLTYYPIGSKQEHYKVIETSKRGHQKPDDRYEAHLTNLARSTRYLAFVRAFNAKGRGPPSAESSVKTLDDVPPTAPALRIHSATSSSVTIAWTVSLASLGSNSPSAATGHVSHEFTLYQRKMGSQRDSWKETPIITKEMLYAINNLECGQSFEFYMTAHNSVGKSEPSAAVVGRTEGAPPLSPPQSEVFARISAHEALVNLMKWKSGGCPIQHFALRMRAKNGRGEWLQLAPRLTSWQELFTIRDLLPSTSYELEVVAQNSAGATQAQYEFLTKGLEAVFKVKQPSPSDNVQKYDTPVTHYGLITPIIVSSLILLLVLLIGCIFCSKDSLLFPHSASRHTPDFLPNSKVPFQAVSMKDLTASVEIGSNGGGGSREHHATELGLLSDAACLRSSSAYARPYDMFPVDRDTSATSTLRRPASHHHLQQSQQQHAHQQLLQQQQHHHHLQQERTLYEALVPIPNEM